MDAISVATLALPMLAGVLAAIGAVAVSVVRPEWLTYGYMAILLSFSVSSFGSLDAPSSPVIWSRGSGQLYFSF